MISKFNITKTFEPQQKVERGCLDTLVLHHNFWGILPTEYTKRENVTKTLQTGGIIKIQVPGYSEFYIKAIEFSDTQNEADMVCGILAKTRQGGGVAGSHLVNPYEIEKGVLHLLRRSNRYVVRSYKVIFTDSKVKLPKISDIKSFFGKEIPALSILDKKIF